jgi:hypothetical protein
MSKFLSNFFRVYQADCAHGPLVPPAPRLVVLASATQDDDKTACIKPPRRLPPQASKKVLTPLFLRTPPTIYSPLHTLHTSRSVDLPRHLTITPPPSRSRCRFPSPAFPSPPFSPYPLLAPKQDHPLTQRAHTTRGSAREETRKDTEYAAGSFCSRRLSFFCGGEPLL